MKKTLSEYWPLILIVVLYTALLSYKLLSHVTPFFDWDESIYIQVGKEMVGHHSWVPQWQGVAWLEKPFFVPYLYGLILTYIPLQPEISTRMFSLFMSIIALVLVFMWVKKYTKSSALATLVTIITITNPIFLQRAQTVNTDVFLLIGWIGYLLVYPSFWYGLLFLFLGVFSKSLLGFYPVILFLAVEVYSYVKHKNNRSDARKRMILIAKQCAVMSIWYILMLVVYKSTFIQVHFIDHMVRRVTSSIESHFGQRTFYLDIIVLQYGWYLLSAILGGCVVIYEYLKKKLKFMDMFAIFFLVPWFIFLNLTKTKISWYIYPALPQAAFLMAYPLLFMRKNKWIYIAVCTVLTLVIAYTAFVKEPFMTTFYSSYDDTYKLAQDVRRECKSLTILIDQDGRKTYGVLDGMHLLISTSAWYGNHPAIVYYSSKPVFYMYDLTSYEKRVAANTSNDCVALEKKDFDSSPDLGTYKLRDLFGDWALWQKK